MYQTDIRNAVSRMKYRDLSFEVMKKAANDSGKVPCSICIK